MHPYLFMSGNCAEAMARYHEVFGGTLEIMTMGDLPEGSPWPPGAEAHHVMHALLKLPNGPLMASDDPSGDGGAKVGIAVAFAAATPGRAQEIFDALAEGGEVTMPFEATFWSKGFGTCTDRFGTPWMIDTQEDA